jgi:hypothetical protein
LPGAGAVIRSCEDLHMTDLAAIAPAFMTMAHQIVWATVATTDRRNRPRSRILHPLWQWDDSRLTGLIATSPTAIKRAHLEHSPFVSVTYWAPNHDTATADCRATWVLDDEGRRSVWQAFKDAPEPVGYDPAIIPQWDSPTSDAFAGLRLEPWQLRVFPGTVLLNRGGEVLTWSA